MNLLKVVLILINLFPIIIFKKRQKAKEKPKEPLLINNINPISDIYNSLKDDIIKYNVKEIWAYNCTFDKNAMIRLFADDLFDELNVVWLDIWSAIIMTKCLTEKYVNFCKENNFLTDKGNCKTSAEIVYAYLTNDVNFKEEHTGKSDCKIEYKILLTAKNTKKKIDGTLKNPWKLVKRFCEINGL